MNYVEYIQTDGYCWFDTAIIPTLNTKVEIVNLWPGVKAGDWPVYFGKSDADWTDCTYTFKSNNDGNAFDSRFGNQSLDSYCSFTIDNNYNVVFDATGVTINNTLYTWTSTPVLDSDSHTLWIAAENNDSTGGDWDRHRASIAKFGEIKVWENNVLIGDFKPAIDNSNNIGFYDEVSQSFKVNLGTGTPVAGPILSSIIATPSKTVLANTGETISIDIDCENAWTVTGDTWLTLSSTGDTGTTTITATAPNYTGTTVRTETLTFTDTDTGDDVTLTLRQKKYQTGLPTFIGLDTIEGIFVGTDEILEAYIGTDLVYASGPFMGLVVKPSSFTLRPIIPSATTVVKSSEYWEITSLPAWLSASTISGNSGETTVVFENTSQSADTADTITIESANYQADIEANYDDAIYTLIDGVRSSSAPSWNLSNCLDTGFYVTGDEDTRFRIKYIGGGQFSDRIVGFDAIECGDDSEDFRYFPEMADAGSCRVNLPSLYSNGQNYDIDFGNLYVYDNINSNMIANYGTCHTINTGTTIRIDMSTNWIQEVIIYRRILNTWTEIADFKAAELGGAYGLYDTVNDTFLTKQDLVGRVSQ